MLVVALVAGAVVLPGGAVALAAQSVPAAAPGLLWEGDAAKGTSVFQALELQPGKVTVANDPTGRFGPSFRYETWDNGGKKSRCESRGVAGVNLDASKLGTTFYVGWKAYWDVTIAKGHWTSFWQLHWSGAGPGGGPMTVRTIGDGKLALQFVSADGKFDRNIWTSPLPMRQWDSFVVAFRLARDSSGFVQFWYNGVPQMFINGSTSYPGPVFKGDHVNLKWGVYRSGANTGHGVEFVNDPKLGTTYDSVKP
ncbi:MAG: hypothetical protein AUI14_10415 [Actinobacteria bacterium 13_2_20CM_2_71_6]|nr:MAG: hypothetical protein AUI14_10415 [Actinobacteria bacterium 13_2_20CM_2_71_6]